MNIRATNSTNILSRWARPLGALLTVTFMVSAAIAAGPTRVNLGTAGNFALLAQTGISVTGVTSITGDIGVSPAAATYITGFGLIMGASGAFSTSSLITGDVYSADYTDPTPTKMTAAVADMGTAYTDAAGRLLPDFTELYAGDITGRTLIPGLYKWSTGILISAGGVTIAGSPSDVWIFQIAGTLTVGNGAIVTLSGGAQASNIFWQVADNTTLGTTSDFKGIILCQTLIEMRTGASLNGRALAQTAVTLDANAVTRPIMATAVKNGLSSQKSGIFQNYSNKSIGFILPANGRATLKILNMQGQEVATAFSGEVEAGKYNQVQLRMSGLAKGLYVSKLEFNGTAIPVKIVFVK
ncbi:MAG: ice-binding family protein [Chitinivibrionales bacterium]|nr:ice-binding family protein [Chitinivibrionales bacterium]